MKRLEELSMGHGEYQIYQTYRKRVEGEIQALKVILEEFSHRSQERQWIRHQSQGELDDGKLVDGMTGDRLIFKRRGYPNASSLNPFQSPHSSSMDSGSDEKLRKKLMMVMDVSGSMYRFNGQDRRLERLLEATLMAMEALPMEGPQSTMPLDYAIRGHSGDSPMISFLEFQDVKPQNEKERMKVLHEMAAHSQYTFSGDHTLEAMELAVQAMKPGSSNSLTEASFASPAAFHASGNATSSGKDSLT